MEANRNILMIRHFSSNVPLEDKHSFMKYFGAVEVQCLESQNRKTDLIFAKFENPKVAEAVLKKLHQVELFGQLLSVEFASNKGLLTKIKQEEIRLEDEKREKPPESRLYKNFVNRLNGWCGRLKLEQPPPSQLKYRYPEPNKKTLENITIALKSIPKLYTQVLHLMNKMNLPCPVVSGEDPEEAETEESESEMESEEGEEEMKLRGAKRKALTQLRSSKVVKSVRTKPKVRIKAESVFDSAPGKLTKDMKICVNLSVSDLKKRPEEKGSNESGFPLMEPIARPLEETKHEETLTAYDYPHPCISKQQLDMNRISSKDFHLLPVFKNYQLGLPSCRLYVKNLARTVIAKDLDYIYRRYYLEDILQVQGSMFDIRVMQEGRMKGQAFVSLQNIKQADLALKETNGYILKGKPMVVQFARSSKS